jgi:hypothetical protein
MMFAFADTFISGCEAPDVSSLDLHGSFSEGEPLAALAGEELGPRFRGWRGASGQRYTFSVYAGTECPAYCDAVMMAVAVGRNGGRRIVAMTDTSGFPEPNVARLLRRGSEVADPVEYHVHLLAKSAAERDAVIEDISATLY